ncbi:hypothetical protein [Streptomyces sp. enrichment culture]|uniref:hypothetical protein n=1 Tax=Streptomyces sp. enrichment culture TaxID=1795815 RepID=UPI003F567EC3
MLLADGSVAEPVYFDAGSGAHVHRTGHWSVYDGRLGAPRAAAFRASCACGWTGQARTVVWDEDDKPLLETGADEAGRCLSDWDQHTIDVGETTVAVPAEITELLEQVEAEIERYAKESPVGAIKLARRMEIIAGNVGYWAAHDARHDMSPDDVARGLGLTADDARRLLAHFGRWSMYR